MQHAKGSIRHTADEDCTQQATMPSSGTIAPQLTSFGRGNAHSKTHWDVSQGNVPSRNEFVEQAMRAHSDNVLESKANETLAHSAMAQANARILADLHKIQRLPISLGQAYGSQPMFFMQSNVQQASAPLPMSHLPQPFMGANLHAYMQMANAAMCDHQTVRTVPTGLPPAAAHVQNDELLNIPEEPVQLQENEERQQKSPEVVNLGHNPEAPISGDRREDSHATRAHIPAEDEDLLNVRTSNNLEQSEERAAGKLLCLSASALASPFGLATNQQGASVRVSDVRSRLYIESTDIDSNLMTLGQLGAPILTDEELNFRVEQKIAFIAAGTNGCDGVVFTFPESHVDQPLHTNLRIAFKHSPLPMLAPVTSAEFLLHSLPKCWDCKTWQRKVKLWIKLHLWHTSKMLGTTIHRTPFIALTADEAKSHSFGDVGGAGMDEFICNALNLPVPIQYKMPASFRSVGIPSTRGAGKGGLRMYCMLKPKIKLRIACPRYAKHVPPGVLEWTRSWMDAQGVVKGSWLKNDIKWNDLLLVFQRPGPMLAVLKVVLLCEKHQVEEGYEELETDTIAASEALGTARVTDRPDDTWRRLLFSHLLVDSRGQQKRLRALNLKKSPQAGFTAGTRKRSTSEPSQESENVQFARIVKKRGRKSKKQKPNDDVLRADPMQTLDAHHQLPGRVLNHGKIGHERHMLAQPVSQAATLHSQGQGNNTVGMTVEQMSYVRQHNAGQRQFHQSGNAFQGLPSNTFETPGSAGTNRNQGAGQPFQPTLLIRDGIRQQPQFRQFSMSTVQPHQQGLSSNAQSHAYPFSSVTNANLYQQANASLFPTHHFSCRPSATSSLGQQIQFPSSSLQLPQTNVSRQTVALRSFPTDSANITGSFPL